MKRFGIAFSLAAIAVLASVIAAPIIVPAGFALMAMLSLFAPEPFPFNVQVHPRSIFETRRAGLA